MSEQSCFDKLPCQTLLSLLIENKQYNFNKKIQPDMKTDMPRQTNSPGGFLALFYMIPLLVLIIAILFHSQFKELVSIKARRVKCIPLSLRACMNHNDCRSHRKLFNRKAGFFGYVYTVLVGSQTDLD